MTDGLKLGEKLSNAELEQNRQRILALLSDRLLVASIDYGKRSTSLSDGSLAQERQELTELVNGLHAADIADLLESLPQSKRHAIWGLLSERKRGKTLVEASDAVWDSLIDDMSDRELLSVLKHLDLNEQAYLAAHLPRDLVEQLLASLDAGQRARIAEVIHLDRDKVGALMDFDIIAVRSDVTLAVVLRFLHRKKVIPDSTDKLFIIDRDNHLLGELKVTDILLNPPATKVASLMATDPVTFLPSDDAEEAAGAFERYNLISAAVVNHQNRLIGRLTVEDAVNVVIKESDSDLRRMGGLTEKEDIFAPVMTSVRKRSTWLLVNLCTAFIASRVIGLFEHTIEQLVALATLMPIVAGIGGNTGNQTITMIVRSLALHHISSRDLPAMLLRELGVAIINGVVWGGVMGGITWLLYGSLPMGGVMTLAMLLNLLLAALMGVIIPMTMNKLGRDPAIGSSVMITALTDTGGFFIFLGLATLFLV
ncbi:magnesium transporter MgtE [Leminorella grimontii]|uniref:Magnesium transporter MgtE n=1 Tax=Leminorella grimontii TaxID=82981 RepID=A0AAV5N8V3_9GAMM|nr:magnesium transporter [Leminorella grimontii]KFC98429.1 MgtE family Mg/Co/Ni transporter [Leminorella grimontii ATCC 33999 = DSM 5078]GKX57226.1 magnesium transporter MgtE [Leminorella grimontii]VFS55937.1 Magnesium transporter mgtE [Leminorella grimontii]